MHFTRLDIVGFKSFADKTRLDLPPGVTCVVGPNGCGKTNIAESIRWVFGEQRPKSLRGGKMEDVIFAGTEHRHPLGMSAVTLTIDNADGTLPVPFSEVSVGRRLYRSGEAEYLMNNAPCRRRDILELFMDTGVGLDAFSFIEQGKIDLVLSSKPEDRRYIFEDAAGITRYRKRQAIAMRKLERTDSNLERLADTIQEVQRRCRSLKRQANAARRYRTLQEELRREELRLARYDYDRAADELHRSSDALKAAGDRLELAGAAVAQGEAAIESARLRQLELETELGHAKQALYNLDTQIDRAEAHIRVLEEKRRSAEQRGDAARTELQVLDARAAQLEEQLAQVRAETGRSEAAVVAASAAVEATTAEMARLAERVAGAEGDVEDARQANLLVLNDKITAENRRASIANQIEMVGGRLARIADRIRHAEEHVAEQARRLADSRGRAQQLARERAGVRTALARAEDERAECHRARTGMEHQLADQREALTAARSKLHSLEQLRDQFEGFQRGVKAVLEAAREGSAWTQGVRGVLADLVSTDREYELAVEAALGAHVQSIVTESGDAADRCIATLRDTTRGRVTCLPLAELDGADWQRATVTAAVPGALAWASDVVRADDGVAVAVRHLLGSTLIVQSPAAAHDLAATLHPVPRMVTLDGDVFEPSGVRSGGAQSDGRGLIGRHNEIAELTDRVALLDREVAAGTDQVEGLKARAAGIEERVTDLGRRAAALDLEIRGLEQDCERSLEALDTGRRQAQHVRAESAAILAERDELLAAQQEVGTEFARLRDLETRVQAELAEAQERLGALLQDKEALNEALRHQQVERAAAEHSLAAHRRDGERLTTLRAETDERLAQRRAEVEDAGTVGAEVEREVATTRERIQQHGLERERAQRALTDLEQQREALMRDIADRDQQLRAARKDHHERTEEAHAFELEVTRLRDRLDGLRAHILEAYQVDLADAPALFPEAAEEPTNGEQQELWDPKTAAELVADLKAQLGKMGPVNLIAIEEYEEYEARRDFLESQEADLKAARGTLLGVIRQINTTIEKKFLETFHAIQQHFHEIFRTLFEGGRGRLALDDPENPLDCGISIDVQPPGKHLQSISLLSGGERALTAAALLFAVFNTRPSPFCVLDEIDAPLDDPNVIRLCRLVEQFAETTQFIVITHNKRTMELANRLYGVTMEERGVSQLVSVELKRDAEFVAAPAAATGIAAA